jgi:beta-1,4-N-acetylglucosaminyltransferase
MELVRLLDAFEGHDLFLITYGDATTRGIHISSIRRTYFIELGDKNIWLIDSLPQIFWHILRVAAEEIKILVRERPDVIFTTGAEIALPISYVGKAMGKKIVFVESLSRVRDLSRTGRIIYPVASLFLVQWEYLAKKYKRARYGGKVF